MLKLHSLAYCRSLGSKELLCWYASNADGYSSGQEQDGARKRGCRKVEQHLSGTHLPVLVHGDIKDSGQAEVGSRIRRELSTEGQSSRSGGQADQKALKDPQPISRKVQKNGVHLLTYLHEE